jgi:peroxiredoxin family protein
MGRQKKHAVILQSDSLSRCAEGLRCAVGLTLVGDHVTVFFVGRANQFLTSTESNIERPIQTLSRLGHELYTDMETSPHDEIEPTRELFSLLQRCDTSASW